MTKTYQLYIGTVKVRKLRKILNTSTEGYTMYAANGHWNKQDLPTQVVVTTLEKRAFERLLSRLLNELPQKCVAYQVVNKMQFKEAT